MSDYFDRVERQIVRNVEAGPPRSSRVPTALGYVASAGAVLVVIAVAGVFLLVRGSRPSPAPATGHGVAVAFTASGLKLGTAPGPAVDRAAVMLRERLHTVFPSASVTTSGDNVTVEVPNARAGTRARVLALAVRGRLAFYDWEADAITPNGRTVASQLQNRDPRALEMSQGSGPLAPGDPGAGSMPLPQADALAAALRGCIVLRSVMPSTRGATSAGERSAQAYVLADVPALTNVDISHPREVRDPQTGAPDVSFDFTARGASTFEAVTKRIARRGDLLSGLGRTFNQHFAIAIDDRLISVPFVDFKQYPDGISGDDGANLTAGFTVQSARGLAAILRYGPLPVVLTATG